MIHVAHFLMAIAIVSIILNIRQILVFFYMRRAAKYIAKYSKDEESYILLMETFITKQWLAKMTFDPTKWTYKQMFPGLYHDI